MDTRRDLILAVCVVVLGIAVLVVAGWIRPGVYRDAVGPRAFPFAIAGLFIVGGAAVAVRRARRMNAAGGYLVETEGTGDEPDHPASFTRALAVMALTVAYAAAFNPAGYLLATPVYVAAALAVMGERRWRVVGALAVGWTLVTYVLFAQLLAVRLPVGPFRAWFRELGLVVL
jgi:putative tricarboxylic transport membrane protein